MLLCDGYKLQFMTSSSEKLQSEGVVTAKTVINFKTLLDKHFINQHFYISDIYLSLRLNLQSS